MKTMKIGTKCKFSSESGNPPFGVTIKSREIHNGMTFYRLKEVSGLFLKCSLDLA